MQDIDYHTPAATFPNRTDRPDICNGEIVLWLYKTIRPGTIEEPGLTRTDRDDASFRFHQDFHSIKGIALLPPARLRVAVMRAHAPTETSGTGTERRTSSS